MTITVSCHSLSQVMWSTVLNLRGFSSDQTALLWQLDIACVAVQMPTDCGLRVELEPGRHPLTWSAHKLTF